MSTFAKCLSEHITKFRVFALPRKVTEHVPRSGEQKSGDVSGLFFHNIRNPAKQPSHYLRSIDLVEHLMAPTGIEVVRSIFDARFTITIDQEFDSLQLLANRIFASRKQING